MNKRVGVILFVFAFFCVFSNLILAQGLFDMGDGLEDELEGTVEEFEEYKDKADELSDKDVRSEYLDKEWKKIIQTNLVTGTVDRGLTFLSPVFMILMKEPYSLSWRFFILLFLWAYLLFEGSKLIETSLFKGWVGFSIALVVLTILAQVGFFQTFYSYIVGLISVFSGWMKWLILVLSLVVIGILHKFNSFFSKYVEEMKEKEEKDKEKFNRWVLDKIVNAFKGEVE